MNSHSARVCRRLALVAGYVLLCALPVGVGGQPDAPAAQPADSATPSGLVNADIVILRDPQADEATKAAAAGRLLATTNPEVRDAVIWLLQPGNSAGDVSLVLLETAAATANVPAWVLEPCRGVVEDVRTSAAAKTAAIGAIGSIRTREAIRTLIPWLDDSSRPELRSPAARALSRQTGRGDLGADQRRWREWFGQIEWLPELEWRTLLAQNLAEAADRATRERDRSTAMLLDSLRARFRDAVTTEQRSGMLVEFLRHEVSAVRKLGIELTRQELANARPLEPSVATAVESLLSGRSREFRRSAAELLGILSLTDGGQAIAAALVREEDTDVVAPLLRAAARNPSADLASVVVRWLEGPAACREPALSAAASLYAAGYLNKPQDVRTLRDALRALPLEDLTPGTSGTLAMYYKLGDDEDRAKVHGLLSTSDPVRRRAAADLLANDPSATDALIAAAAADPTLVEAATRAVSLHRATIDGYEAIARLPAANEAARQERLLSVATGLPPRDLLAAAMTTDSPVFRDAILSRLTETTELQAFGVWRSAKQSPHPAVVAGMLLLCRTRLELGRPAGALEVLTDLQPIAAVIDSAEFDGLKTIALLWLNRIDEAEACNASVSAWVDGLENAIGLPHAAQIVRAIDTRFGTVDGPEGQRLTALRSRLPRN